MRPRTVKFKHPTGGKVNSCRGWHADGSVSLLPASEAARLVRIGRAEYFDVAPGEVAVLPADTSGLSEEQLAAGAEASGARLAREVDARVIQESLVDDAADDNQRLVETTGKGKVLDEVKRLLAEKDEEIATPSSKRVRRTVDRMVHGGARGDL
jgi:hypothetical protein